MDNPSAQLIDAICSPDPATVAAALQAAAPHHEALGPVLLARLMQAVAEPGQWTGGEGRPSPVFLPYLAAAWKLTNAHPLIVALLRLPPDNCDAMLGDFITEGARLTLADTWPGDLRAIERLALDERADPYSRGAAFNAATLLTVRGVLPRSETLAFFERIAAAPFDADNENDVTAATGLVSSVVDFRAWELRGTVAALFERDLVDGGWVGQEEEVLAELEPGTSFEPDTDRFPPPITDAWATVGQWAFFDELKPGRGKLSARQLHREAAQPKPAPAATAAWREARPYLARSKVGRNDPCPCGSGRKYKKCHGA